MTGNLYSWGNVLIAEQADFLGSEDTWEAGTTPAGYYNGQAHADYVTINTIHL